MTSRTLLLVVLVLTRLTNSHAVAQVLERANVAPGGAQAVGGDSVVPALSADGRYLVYVSAATNLVPNDTNSALDVFLRDRQSGSTQRVSVATDGTQANGHSFSGTISGNGRYVAFWSEATNLVPGDANNAIDVFVRDTVTSQTSRIATGSVPYGHESTLAAFRYSLHTFLAISDDGRYVAYSPSILNDSRQPPIVRVHDRVTAQELVIENGARPSISADGRYVAFESAEYTTSARRAYISVFDRTTGMTARASVNNNGENANGDCYWPSMAAQGRFVVFECRATNLVAGDTDNAQDIVVRDLQLGQTSIASVGNDGVRSVGPSLAPTISGDGRFVVFAAGRFFNLPQYLAVEIYVRDREIGETRRLTQHREFNAVHASSFSSAISTDGQWVAFASSDADLVGADTNAQDDVFLLQNRNCDYAISPAAQSFAATGGGGSLTITAPTGCDWTATSQASWITLSGVAQGSGNGTITFSVAPNSASSTRTGTVTIAGQLFTATQSGASAPLPGSFGKSTPVNGSVGQALNPTLSWSPSSGAASYEYCFDTTHNNQCDTAWISVAATAVTIGELNPNTRYAWQVRARNTSGSTDANGSLWWSFTTRCTYALSPTSASIGRTGASGTVSVVTQPGCSWLAEALSAALTVTQGSSGVGSGVVRYTVSANSALAPRSLTLRIAGESFLITQLGTVIPALDLNGDGRLDFLWQHQGDGRISGWLMNGTHLADGTLLTPPQVADTNWKLAGAGDLDGDGQMDLVWQNIADGRTSAWLMDGLVRREGTLFSIPQVPDTGWRVRSVGDLNGDGRADLFWQHQNDGLIAVWLMDGTTVIDGTLLNPSVRGRLELENRRHCRLRRKRQPGSGLASPDGRPYSDLVHERHTSHRWISHESSIRCRHQLENPSSR